MPVRADYVVYLTTKFFFPFLYFKVKNNPALILTLEEAHLTLEGRDLPSSTFKTRKS